MNLKSPLTDVKGVGAELGRKFKVLGIETVGQLIDYYPRRYDDYSAVVPIGKIRPGAVTIKAVIKQARGRYVRRGMHLTEAVASDETGSVRLIWFNQPYREGSLKSGAEYYISGQFELGRGRLSLMNPSVELVSAFPINTARIIPIYRETKGLNSRQIRKAISECLKTIRELPETLPSWILKDYDLLGRAAALESLHFPRSSEDLERAKHRLGFEEVFELVLASFLNKRENQAEHALKISFQKDLAQNFAKSLPFKLTDSQRKVVWQIYQDLEKPSPMNRLVEGDVGSGKTVVAAMAALMAIRQNFQVAFMAPTELLARQHAETIYKLLEPLNMQQTVCLLVGSLKPAEKLKAHQAIKKGEAKFIVGTHALISEKVDMKSLALVIVDEQHRFGVEQRKKLMSKAGHMPHVLSLTATPIPRSLALTVFGELDVSILAEKPSGRLEIVTKIISPNSRQQLYEKIDKELSSGRQMFVVCPLISENSADSSKSAEEVYKNMAKSFKGRRVDLLHGKMKADEKNKVMEAFVNGETDILVSTTVIEVGVDVPNASVMLIESAERFGLAQIHQLRGRVGRGGHAGYCYLMMSDSQSPSRRLRALQSTNDGFKLAELDLELRGPGAIYGQMQHGQLDLRIAQITDSKLTAAARHAASEFINRKEKLSSFKELKAHIEKIRKVTNLN